MDKEAVKRRTKQFALRVIRLTESLPKGETAEVLGRQLLRSGTSVGANYRAAVLNQLPISSQRWERWKKRRMNRCIGWSC
jgi:hypothetical protein